MDRVEEGPGPAPEERVPEGSADSPEAAAGQGEAAAEAPAQGPRDLKRYLLTAAISAGVLIFALAFFMAGFAAHALLDDDDGGGGITTGSSDVGVANTAEDDPYWGPEDAPVVIEEFSDFQCPFCRRFAIQTLPKIKETYGDKVRFIYRDFPISSIHPQAQKAAEAGQCAYEQGKFWEFHDMVFENQDAIAVPDLKGYAEQLGLDMNQFNECLDSGKYTREVALDRQDGNRAGVTGTPGFLINGLLVIGAQPFEQFQAVIEQALAAAE